MFGFRRATVFCLGYRLSNHKMSRYAKYLRGMARGTQARDQGDQEFSKRGPIFFNYVQ